MSLLRQLEEIQLLDCSLLPGELLLFLEDTHAWTTLLAAYPDIDEVPSRSVSEPCFQIKLEEAPLWFEVKLPHDYPTARPAILVRGGIAKTDQSRWQDVVKEKLEDLDTSDYPVYELFSLHLLPLMHAEFDNTLSPSEEHVPSVPSPAMIIHYHALLTSHHLVSPQKRRSMQQWSSKLSISGFAKVGHPGIIYAEGAQDNVEEFVGNVKGMQWLALRVRFVEPIESSQVNEGHWAEFQKVGEVVEEMKRLGREDFILDMGIGSAGSK